MTGEMQRIQSGTFSHDGWAAGGATNLFDHDPSSKGINGAFFQAPGSDHVGGAHFGMADGAVRFVSENVDATTWRALGTYDRKEIIGEF